MNKETIEEFFELRKGNKNKLLDGIEKKDEITNEELLTIIDSKLYLSLYGMTPADRCKLIKTLTKIPKNQEEAAKTYVVERKNQKELEEKAKDTMRTAQGNAAQGVETGNQ